MNRLSADDRAQVLDDATQLFWKHITPIVWMAFAIHILLFGVFVALDISLLWAANALSMLVYVACLGAVRHKRYSLAGLLISVEIIAHAALATWLLGWDSNFYFYLFCVVPIIAFSFQAAPFRRGCLCLAIAVVVVAGFVLRRHTGTLPGVSAQVLDGLGIANAMIATGLLLHATARLVRFTFAMQLNLYHAAHRDSLTSLYNRRQVLQRLQQLAPERNPASTAVILLDIDHFKQINDRHGHDLGDTVLQATAKGIASCLRITDLAARWGGEEFLVLLPNTSLADAQGVAQRIRIALAEPVVLPGQTPLVVTATLAVATLQPGENFRDTLKRADQMLYQGKREGRDRVMLAL